MGAITEIRTESAYDAMQEGMPFVVRLVSEPATFEELHAIEPELPRAQVEQRLKRLVRNGLVREDGNRYEAVAQMVHQVRQEGIITSLSRYILPMVTNLVRAPGGVFVTQLDLELPHEEQEQLRSGLVQDAVLELDRLSSEPGEKRILNTFVVVGTSDVPPRGDDGERLLETVRRSARQRSIASAAKRAVLMQQEGYFADHACTKAEQVVRSLADRLMAFKSTDAAKANYTLALAFGPREGTEV